MNSSDLLASRLAAFASCARWEELSTEARAALSVRVLDALGCAIGALDAEPVKAARAVVNELGGNPRCTLIGGGRSAPDRAAFYNGAIVRYLDFNDSYLAKGETCHPSDALGAVLAAAEYAGASGRDLLVALAVSYEVQCRLSEVAPVRDRGFDHTTQGAYAVAAGVSRALGLDAARTANAVAIAGASLVALRVTRTGALSHWKGLAFPNMAFNATHAAFLARAGITGPLDVFEGEKGFMSAVVGPFDIDWESEGLERVRRTIVKRFDGEIHAQSAVEAILELRTRGGFTPTEIDHVEIAIFDVAHRIIGGGEEGDKTFVETREQADHSLPYMIAVALLDGQLLPEQYAPERLARADVQELLRRVFVRPADDLSRRFPDEHACRVRVHLRDGRVLSAEKRDYEGFFTRPATWETVRAKFDRLAAPFVDRASRDALADTVERLHELDAAALPTALAGIRTNRAPARKVA